LYGVCRLHSFNAFLIYDGLKRVLAHCKLRKSIAKVFSRLVSLGSGVKYSLATPCPRAGALLTIMVLGRVKAKFQAQSFLGVAIIVQLYFF
jgi:hypothetical protein